MKIIYFLFILFLLNVVYTQEGTKLTYFVTHEVEQQDDYIEITLVVKSQSQSLSEAISAAGKVTSEIGVIANGYCKENSKKAKGDCKEAVDIGSFEIEPQYQQVRKETVFTAFVVSHEVAIKVFFTERIGELVDRLNKLPDLTLKGFQWQPLEEVDPEQSAIKEGLEQGEGLCKQVGLTLGKIIDIEEVIEEAEEEEKEQEEEEEEDEEEPEIIKYKFEVQCVQKAKPAKK